MVRRALQSAPVEGLKLTSLEDLESLNVVSRCACGCASVDFKFLGAGEIAELLADAIGDTSSGEEVGVLVFGVNGRIIGLRSWGTRILQRTCPLRRLCVVRLNLPTNVTESRHQRCLRRVAVRRPCLRNRTPTQQHIAGAARTTLSRRYLPQCCAQCRTGGWVRSETMQQQGDCQPAASASGGPGSRLAGQ